MILTRGLRAAWLQILVHVLALAPLARLLWDFDQGQLTAEPVREIQLRTGRYALSLLVLSLACRPAYAVTRLRWVLKLRRLLGLYAFAYASLHLLNFLVLDYGLDFALIWADAGEKRFALAGLAAFLILLVLTITSTAGWKRRLGERWRRLHRLVYLAALLAAAHFIWQTKIDFTLPFIYTGLIVLLLVLRLPGVLGALIPPSKRRRQAGPQSTADDL